MRIVYLTAVFAAMSLSACVGLTPFRNGSDTIIASNHDTGIDSHTLSDGHAAIAYDPSGCQVWIIDDGVEGYAGRRYDPKSGLPVCNNLYAPGTVLGDYRAQSPNIPDWHPTY